MALPKILGETTRKTTVPGVTRALESTAICYVCGAPYLTAQGHDCPRLSACRVVTIAGRERGEAA